MSQQFVDAGGELLQLSFQVEEAERAVLRAGHGASACRKKQARVEIKSNKKKDFFFNTFTGADDRRKGGTPEHGEPLGAAGGCHSSAKGCSSSPAKGRRLLPELEEGFHRAEVIYDSEEVEAVGADVHQEDGVVLADLAQAGVGRYGGHWVGGGRGAGQTTPTRRRRGDD